jgi:hypothetical protein
MWKRHKAFSYPCTFLLGSLLHNFGFYGACIRTTNFKGLYSCAFVMVLKLDYAPPSLQTASSALRFLA